jgi:hypothetical protein
MHLWLLGFGAENAQERSKSKVRSILTSLAACESLFACSGLGKSSQKEASLLLVSRRPRAKKKKLLKKHLHYYVVL